MLALRHFLLCATCVLCIAPAVAIAAPSSGIISGSVIDNAGTPVANATVRATNSAGVDRGTTTATNGGFRFDELPLGVYTVRAAKEGYAATILTDVPVISGSESSITLVLGSPSMTSIKALGQIVVVAGTKTFNTGIASINTISGSQFIDQGQISVQRVLDQTPGIVTGHPLSDPAVASAFTFPNIRGGLSYETAQLIDGHPVTSGFAGHFFNNNLASYALDDVELVKGPGAIAPVVNYAINGSVNYRIKEPTRIPTFSIDYGTDSQDGSFINLLASGRPSGSRFGYVFSYYSFGTEGPFHHQPTNTLLLFQGSMINGQVIANFPYTFAFPPGTTNSFALTSVSAFAGGFPMTGSTLIRSEVLKLRYDFSSASTISAGFLGSQQTSSYVGTYATLYDTLFTPATGYAGSIAPGPLQINVPAALEPDSPQSMVQPLYELEFDTRIKSDTILARYYETVGTFYQNTSPTGSSPFIASYPIYGTVSLCPSGTTLDPSGSGNCGPSGGPFTTAPIPTTFNGQTAQVNIPSVPSSATIQDRLGGASIQYNHAAGPNLYTLAFDKNEQKSIFDDSFAGTTFHIIPAGSGQRFITLMLRASLNPSDKLQYLIANYFNTYHFDYVDTFGGLGFKHSDSNYDAWRFGVGYRPNHNIAWRVALGTSIAPPFLNLLSNTATPPFFSPTPFRNYSQTVSNGQLKPETAFGLDLGQDLRFARGESTFTWDIYRTDLRNQFLHSTVLIGTFNDGTNGPAPLFSTSNGNLGKARYEGVEFGVRHNPALGFGYVVQGALMRAYPYDLPPGFYDLPGQPLSTNLGIIPGINYTAAGIENFPIPYSQGYAEANYRLRSGITADLGMTYYGNNNSFAVPAFFVGSSNLHIPFGAHSSLQVSVDNLFDVHGGKFSVANAGIPAPLANGTVQLNLLNPQGPPLVRFIIHHDFGP